MNMNWYIIILLSLLGFIMGAFSLKGLTQGIELYLWLTLGIFSVFLIVCNVDERYFLHAFLVGLFWGIANAATQSTFFDMYMSNNAPDTDLKKLPEMISPRLFALLMGPITGAVTGGMLGLLAFLTKKIL